MKKLTVSEIMRNENIMIQKNKINVVVAPAGSGKTYYIFNQLLNAEEKSIYLCDTSNLKEAILRDNEYFDMTQSRRENKLFTGFHNDKYNCTVMTYAEYFYHYNDDEYMNVSTIICDEIHNLFKYKDKFDNEECENYSKVIEVLKEKSKKINVIGFTATHDRLKREMNFLLPNNDSHINRATNNDWNIINLSHHKDIKKLKENFVSAFGDISQINYWFARTNLFKYGKKCLIYTDRITTALEIEEYLNAMFNNLKAISLWSLNNKNHIMSEEQLRVRSEILTTGLIPEEYNILIINASYETGINIKDEDVEIVIINNSTLDTIVQARSRVRKNIELLMYKVPRSTTPSLPTITVPTNYLDIKLTTKQKRELIKLLDLRDSFGRLIGWSSFKTILLYNHYQVKDSTIRINKVRTRVSEITDTLKR